MAKIRLDLYLVEHQLAPSRAKAQTFIQGTRAVYVNDELITKPAFLVDETDQVKVVQLKPVEYVSRAGYKLAKAIELWNLELTGLTCLDIGASTGGFSECCLLNQAKTVIAVDVGHDQLAAALKNDSRIKQLDHLNFRYATTKEIPETIGFYCCDVSFISLDHIIPALKNLNLGPKSFGVFLIKPQFETTRERIKNGRALDQELHFEVIKKVLKTFQAENFFPQALAPSPIKGHKKSNLEYLLLVSTNPPSTTQFAIIDDSRIKATIQSAWKLLEKKK